VCWEGDSGGARGKEDGSLASHLGHAEEGGRFDLVVTAEQRPPEGSDGKRKKLLFLMKKRGTFRQPSKLGCQLKKSKIQGRYASFIVREKHYVGTRKRERGGKERI